MTAPIFQMAKKGQTSNDLNGTKWHKNATSPNRSRREIEMAHKTNSFTDNEVCGECAGGPVGQARPVAMSATAGIRFQAGPTER